MPLTMANRPAAIPSIQQRRGTGWLPPPVDPRDYTEDTPVIAELRMTLAGKLGEHRPTALTAPPSAVDLRPWCSPIEDQGALGSCTANAAMGCRRVLRAAREGEAHRRVAPVRVQDHAQPHGHHR